MYYLDSSICIGLMRGRMPITYQLMLQMPPKLFGIPSIVAAELHTGVEKSKNPSIDKLKLEQFLAPFAIVDFDASCASVYGKIRADLEHRGLKIGPNDLLIAACAIAHNATLITNNVEEFIRVNGLDLENWEEMELPS